MASDETARRKFAENLKRVIDQRDLSQSELARRAGIGRDSISGYVNGHNLPNSRNMARLCRTLRVTAEQLLAAELAPRAKLSAAPAAPREAGTVKMLPLPGDGNSCLFEVAGAIIPMKLAIELVAMLRAGRCG